MNLTQTILPEREPVSLAAVKTFLKVEHDLEDSLIERLIVSARQHAEQLTRNQMITATWELRLDGFCQMIRLPRPPLQSITSIKYIDTNGVLQTIPSTDYQVVGASAQSGVQGYVTPAYDKTWPTTRDEADAVRILYVTGWGDDPDEVPGPIVDWILVQVSTRFENRQLMEAGQLTELRFVDALLRPYTVRIVA